MACSGKCLLRFPEEVGSSPASAWDSAAVARPGDPEAGSCPMSAGCGGGGGGRRSWGVTEQQQAAFRKAHCWGPGSSHTQCGVIRFFTGSDIQTL